MVEAAAAAAIFTPVLLKTAAGERVIGVDVACCLLPGRSPWWSLLALSKRSRYEGLLLCIISRSTILVPTILIRKKFSTMKKTKRTHSYEQY